MATTTTNNSDARVIVLKAKLYLLASSDSEAFDAANEILRPHLYENGADAMLHPLADYSLKSVIGYAFMAKHNLGD